MTRTTSLFAIATLLMTAVASGQDFYGSGVSAATSRRAGIFISNDESPTDALVLNPAGLAILRAPMIDMSLAGIFARGSFSNASNINSPMAPNNGFVPFGAFGASLGKHWAMGVGVTPDLLSVSKWNYSDTPGFAGTTYGAQTEKSQILATRYAVGSAYRFSDRLSVGVTLGADFNSNTLNAPYIFQSHPVLAGLKTLLDLHTTGYGWNGSAGISYRPSRVLEVNASYRTPTSITSHGHATGNMGAEFQALGLAAQPRFAYDGQVNVKLPPSALFGLSWRTRPSIRLGLQTNWTGWRGSFHSLPVTLTNGDNPDINGLLGTNVLKDSVPLEWKDQFTFRGSVERVFGEGFRVGGGYVHGNNPVPNSTISPLTAAIMQNGLTGGVGWRMGGVHLDASYGLDFTATARSSNSALLYNEYSNATTKIGTQSFTLSARFGL